MNRAAVLQNSGDRLVLDYSTVTDGGVTSSVDLVDSTLEPFEFPLNEFDNEFIEISTNQGSYSIVGGTNSVQFSNIELLNVTGSDQDDLLVGTYDSSAI